MENDLSSRRGLMTGPSVAIFAPNPLLSVTIEAAQQQRDDVHMHAGGQGVWVARMVSELGARAVLCFFIGGETGRVLDPLLAGTAAVRHAVQTAGATGCYVIDRRGGSRELVAQQFASPPSRHELDDLVSVTCAAAIDCDVLVVCNPYPAETVPLDVYGALISDVRVNGTPVLVDLSSPRLESALAGHPDLVKLNDWELAEFVYGPVGTARELRAAAERLRDLGAGLVVVTRGEKPAFVLEGDQAYELATPRFDRGFREGCGDSMMGAIAAAWAAGRPWQEALTLGAAAGATNFLRHGLGTGSRTVVEELLPRVTLQPV